MDINELCTQAYTIHVYLGHGHLEKVYENALAHELRKAGLSFGQQVPISVLYDGVCVGDYTADLLVEDLVIVELKSMKALDDVHLAQCLNYLKATGKPLCLLINFGAPKIEVRRLAGPSFRPCSSVSIGG